MPARSIGSVGARSAVVVLGVVAVVGAAAVAFWPGADGTASPSPVAASTPTATATAAPTASSAATLASPSPTATAARGPLDLTNLEWVTLTEPFGGADARDIDGVLLDATGRVVVWGSRLVEGLSGARPHVWASADMETWTEAPLGDLEDRMQVMDVAAGPRGLVAVGFTDDLVSALWSRDGVTWQRAAIDPQPLFEEDTVMAVAAGPSGFLAVGYIWPVRAEAWFSADGLSWRRVGPAALPEGELHDVVVLGDGSFLAVGTDKSGHDWNAMAWRIAADGRQWHRAPGQEALNGPQDDSLTRLWHHAGGFLARGLEEDTEQRVDCVGLPVMPTASLEVAWVCAIDERQFTLSSADGSHWQRHADSLAQIGEFVAPPPTLWELTAVDRWGDGLIAVGAGSDWQIRVWLSVDGSAWQPVGEPVAVGGRLPTVGQDDAITGLVVAGEMLIVTGEGDAPEMQGFVLIGRSKS
jgi:hypothetical protein